MILLLNTPLRARRHMDQVYFQLYFGTFHIVLYKIIRKQVSPSPSRDSTPTEHHRRTLQPSGDTTLHVPECLWRAEGRSSQLWPPPLIGRLSDGQSCSPP